MSAKNIFMVFAVTFADLFSLVFGAMSLLSLAVSRGMNFGGPVGFTFTIICALLGLVIGILFFFSSDNRKRSRAGRRALSGIFASLVALFALYN